MDSISSKNEYRIRRKLMGCAFELIVVDETSKRATDLLESGVREMQRIETLLSEFILTSVTSTINQNAGIKPVIVDKEVFDLLMRCQQISQLTQGAFDITVGPLKKIYEFKKKQFAFPKSDQINNVLNQVGYQHLILDPVNRSVFLSKQHMHISFAAIGKGYAADCLKKLWLSKGVSSGLINASGDLTAFGLRHDDTPWKLGIPNPDNKDLIQYYLPLQNTSVATSGDYEQFFIHDGIRYSHSIHPKTGMPTTGIKSVSIFSLAAELSDALATAVFVMGVDVGLHLINQLPKTHCIIIDDQNEAHFSKEITFFGIEN